MSVDENMKHVIALSGGKDSTAMALRLREIEPRDYVPICTPTGDEPDEMFAHWRRLGEMLGTPIVPIVHPLGLVGLIEEQEALPNVWMRWCTRMLKIEPCRRWLATNAPATLHVGLRADEEVGERPGGDYSDIAGVTVRYPLREWGWDLADVWNYLETRGFRRPGPETWFAPPGSVSFPVRTDCDLCFFQTLHEWWRLWRYHPEKYRRGEELEAMTGHTFRSPQRDTWPAALKDLRAEFEAGRVPKQRRDATKRAQCRACTL